MDKKIVTKRIYDAPVELVWKAWTEPELIKKWWGPDHFTCNTVIVDFREGGKSIVSMQAPASFGGAEWFNLWQYRKIIPLKRIEFDQRFSDKTGKIIKPQDAGMPGDFPDVVFTVVSFEDLGGGQTAVTVVQHADMGSMAKNAQLGIAQSLDKMTSLFQHS